MWNALVGFCGLVSIGQQAFFGLGAYAAIRLADLGVSVYPSLFIGALIVGALSSRVDPDAEAQGRRIRDRHVGGLGARASARQPRHAGSRRNRSSLIELEPIQAATSPCRSPIGAPSSR